MKYSAPYFVQISDTHLGAAPGYLHRGFDPLLSLERTLAEIASLPIQPDFIIHTGDLAGDKENHASEAHYRLAAASLATIKVPFYFIAGNHDDAPSMRSVLSLPSVDLLTKDPGRFAYRFDRGGFRFYTLDANIPTERPGILPQDQLDALESDIAGGEFEFAVFLHHPPLVLDADWMDRYMLVENGMDLHRILSSHAPRVRGVFFGHCHQNMQILRDGILYASCASSFFQFRTLPGDNDCVLDTSVPNGFNFVRLSPGETNLRPRAVLQDGRIILPVE
jgi:Icc protein